MPEELKAIMLAAMTDSELDQLGADIAHERGRREYASVLRTAEHIRQHAEHINDAGFEIVFKTNDGSLKFDPKSFEVVVSRIG